MPWQIREAEDQTPSTTGDNDRGRLTPLTREDIPCLVREVTSQLHTDNLQPQAALVPGMLLIL